MGKDFDHNSSDIVHASQVHCVRIKGSGRSFICFNFRLNTVASDLYQADEIVTVTKERTQKNCNRPCQKLQKSQLNLQCVVY